jgi:hypothetical protein
MPMAYRKTMNQRLADPEQFSAEGKPFGEDT